MYSVNNDSDISGRFFRSLIVCPGNCISRHVLPEKVNPTKDSTHDLLLGITHSKQKILWVSLQCHLSLLESLKSRFFSKQYKKYISPNVFDKFIFPVHFLPEILLNLSSIFLYSLKRKYYTQNEMLTNRAKMGNCFGNFTSN